MLRLAALLVALTVAGYVAYAAWHTPRCPICRPGRWEQEDRGACGAASPDPAMRCERAAGHEGDHAAWTRDYPDGLFVG